MDAKKQFEICGVKINATNLNETINFLTTYNYKESNYILFPDTSVIAAAQNNAKLIKIINGALLSLPDGKPSEIYGRLKGFKNVSTVSAYWLCINLLKTNLTHYFIGSTIESLKKIISKFPNENILGYSALPFKNLEFYEQENLIHAIIENLNIQKPDLIWIGISSPKQDFFINSHLPKITHGIMLGAGGALDYLSGDNRKSPEWVKKIGLRWSWRLIKEPKRLIPKYWSTLKIFVNLFIKSLIK